MKKIYEFELTKNIDADKLHLILTGGNAYKTALYKLANLRAVSTIDPNFLETYDKPEKIAYFCEKCPEAKFVDKLSTPENLAGGGTLIICDRRDLFITTEQCAEFTNCLLKNCRDIIIDSKIAGNLRMFDCADCKFRGSINKIEEMENCTDCKFDTIFESLTPNIFDHKFREMEKYSAYDPEIISRHNVKNLKVECDEDGINISNNTIRELTVYVSLYDRYDEFSYYEGGHEVFIYDCKNLEIINIDADIIYDIRNCSNLRKINHIYHGIDETKYAIINCPKLCDPE